MTDESRRHGRGSGQASGGWFARIGGRSPARVAALEAEHRHVFEDAQREADTMFAQYQLSQLLASGDDLEDLSRAVLVEIIRSTGATSAALWLAEPNDVRLSLVTIVRDGPDGEAEDGAGGDPPRSFVDASAAAAWAAASGWSGVLLEESRDIGERGIERAAIGFLAVGAPAGVALEPGHVRYLALVRRELAITFRSAQLRSSLARERATLEAILEGASDAIIAVGADLHVVQVNAAAVRLLGRSAADNTGAPCHEFLDCGPLGAGTRSAASDGDGGEAAARRCGVRCPFAEVLETGRPIAAR